MLSHILLFLASFAALVYGQATVPILIQLEAKTLDLEGAGQTLGSVTVDIRNNGRLSCDVELKGRFPRGDVETFAVV